MNRTADEYIRQRSEGGSRADVLDSRRTRLELWVKDAESKEYVLSNYRVTRRAKELGVPVKTEPRVDLEHDERHWVPGWFWALIEGRDITQAYRLIAPRHFREDLEDMRLVVIESLIADQVVGSKRGSYKYFLQLTENESCRTSSLSKE